MISQYIVIACGIVAFLSIVLGDSKKKSRIDAVVWILIAIISQIHILVLKTSGY